MPTIYIIGGPNGAGKSTASQFLLTDVFNTKIFINADNIAAEINPANPEEVAIRAGRIMLEQIEKRLHNKETFAIETALASRSYLNLIKRAQILGYKIELYFFYLASIEMAIERVKLRVSEGGHNIPRDTIERRYYSGIKNFFDYILITDRWYFYDNSTYIPSPVARGEMPDTVIIYNFDLWQLLKEK